MKKELSVKYGDDRHCDIAEIAAIINTCGIIKETKHIIKIQTENVYVAQKYFALVKKTFGAEMEVLMRRNKQLNKNRIYMIFVKDPLAADKILLSTGMQDSKHMLYQKRINKLLTKSSCCKRAYIRGAFLSTGSLTNPEKNYHLEFVNNDESHATELSELINSFKLSSKVVLRKEHFVVYLKEGEQIVDLLNIMGAHNSLMALENIRILKEMRNSVNRLVNCETANLNKTISASVQQVEDINLIKSKKGLLSLSPQLEEIAMIRLQYPNSSLKEIGQMLSPPVGKSGVNHRLRKISDIAECLRREIL